MSTEVLLFAGLGLLALSIFLVMAELFIPSGGVIAAIASVSAIAGVVSLFRVSTMWGVTGLLAVIILGPIAFNFALKIWPNTPVGRRILHGTLSEADLRAKEEAEIAQRDQWKSLLDQTGETLTALRPIGTIRISDQRYDALAESASIPAGTPIRVVEVQGRQIKVRAVDATDSS